MKRGLAWVGGALGLAALLRLKRRATTALERPQADPAAELRARLEQARDAPDDRDEYDAAEGQALDTIGDEVGKGRSIDDRRRAIHEQAQRALGEMRGPDSEE